MASEFGALRTPEDFGQTEEQSRRAFMGLLRIGRTFGIMGSRQIVTSGIITDRTRPGELHFPWRTIPERS